MQAEQVAVMLGPHHSGQGKSFKASDEVVVGGSAVLGLALRTKSIVRGDDLALVVSSKQKHVRRMFDLQREQV